MIGIDIQPREMRLVKLRRKSRALCLEWAFVCPLPEQTAREGKIYQWDNVASFLSESIQQRALGKAEAAIAMPADLVRMQTLVLPQGLSDREIEAEIETHLQQDLPQLREAVSIDFVTSLRRDGSGMDVSFFAVRQEVLSQYMTCIHAAGLKTKVVDVDIYALKRAVGCLLPSTFLAENYLVLYSSGQFAMLLALHRKEIVFHQSWVFVEYKDFSIQLRRAMQFYAGAYPKMAANSAVLCTPYRKAADVLCEICSLDLYFPDFFHCFSFTNKEEASVLSSGSFDFLLALGLAMREVPAW